MSTLRRFNRVHVDVLRRRKHALASVTAGVLAAMMGARGAQAAGANWNASPTNGNWEATTGETNWSTGAATFPGTTTSGSTTNTDVATFNAISSITSINVNATAANSMSLNLAGITFTGANLSSYTIGSTTGNALVMTSNTAQTTSTDQIVISGSGRNGAATAITETINAPIVIAPQAAAGGNYTFQNNSTILANTDALVINGSVSGATTTFADTLSLIGGSTNINNAVNGVISDGGAAGGMSLFAGGVGTWTLAGNNTYSGSTNVTAGGLLRITGNYSGNGAAILSNGGGNSRIVIQTAGTVQFSSVSLNNFNCSLTLTSGTLITGSLGENAASGSRQYFLNGGTVKLTGDIGTATPAPWVLNGVTIANDKSGGATLTINSFQTNVTTPGFTVQGGGATFDTTLGSITSGSPLVGAAAGTINVIGGNTLKIGGTNTGVMSVQGTSTWDVNGVTTSVAGLAGSGTVTNSGAAITLTDTIASGSQTFSGAITGGANLAFSKSAAGTQVLSGTSSFTGATVINAGALVVTGSLTTSPVTVNNSGTLAGTGNGTTTGLLGSVVLATGSQLLPGTSTGDGSVGTLTMTSLDGTNGSERFDLVSPGVSDMISTGSATFSAANTFTLVGTPAAGTYTLVQSSTALAGAGPSVVFPTGTRETFTSHYADGTSGPNLFTLVVTGNAANLTWTGTASNVWNVNGDINWNNGTGSDVFFNLDAVTFTNGAANESIALNTTVQPSSILVNNDGSNPYSITGTGSIIGSGTTLTKQGVGTLILATNNTYAGNTTVSGGVLQVGNGGTTGSLGTTTVTLSNNAVLAFNLSGTAGTLSNAVNGAGVLHQMGPGTLTITSSNNYTSSTIIDSGSTLQLGNGGATGNLGATSDVQDNGALIYNRTNTGTISAPITGTGSLQVIAGTLSLGANNSYMGTTTINTGATLQVGSGSTTGSVGTGPLTNNGTLAFNRSDTLTAPALSGTGGLQQNGAGTLLLTAAGSYSGATTVSNGTLAGLHPNAFGNTPAITISNVAGTVSFRQDTSTTFARPIDSTPYTVSLTATGGTIDVNQATVAGAAAKVMTIGNIDASTSTSTPFNLNFTGANSTALTAGNFNGPASTVGAAVNVNNNNTSGTTTLNNYQSNNTAGNDTLTFQGNGNTTLTGGIMFSNSTDVNVIANGPGNLTILGSSNYTLTTTITNGTVAIGNDGAFGQSSVNLNAPDPAVGTLQSADMNTRTLNNPITNSSSNFTLGAPGTGNLVFNGTWAKGQFPKNLIINNAVTTINGVVSNAPGANGAFSKSGPGTLVLSNANAYDAPTIVFAGTLVAANGTNGSATGPGVTAATGANADVTLNGGTLASDPVAGGTIAGNVLAGTGAHTIAPGGIGSIGTFTIGGLTSTNLTTLNFDLGTGTGVVTNGDLLSLTPTGGGISTVNVGAGTAITLGGTSVVGNDYRLIGGNISGINLSNFVLPAAPSGQGYALNTSVDPGFIDLVVSVVTGPQNLVWSGGTAVWDVSTSANWNANAAKFNQGDIVTFDNTNTGSNTVTMNTTVQPSGTVSVNGSHAYVFNGTGGIANASSGPATSLTQTGTGSLTISTVNTYTGATTIGTGSDTPALTLASAGKIASTSLTVASGAIANINGLLTGTPAVTVAGAATLGAADGTNGSASAILTRTWSTLNVSGNLTVAAAPTHAGRTVLVLTSASANPLTNTGKINLSNNDMIIQHGNTGSVSTAGSIAAQLKAGFNAGSGYWNGASGIVSGSAAGDTRFLTTIGYRPSDGSAFDGVSTTAATDVLVKYTYYGDADLSGTVNGSDYHQIDLGFGGNLTGWSNGDFNYDGVVNGSDYALIDNTFNQIAATGASPLAIVASDSNLLAATAATSAVPEPTTLGLLGIGVMGLSGRRRRRNV